MQLADGEASCRDLVGDGADVEAGVLRGLDHHAGEVEGVGAQRLEDVFVQLVDVVVAPPESMEWVDGLLVLCVMAWGR